MALLEAIAALTILTIAGAVGVSLTLESMAVVRHSLDAEEEVRAENAFLAAVSIWTRDDLDRHLGERIQGHWRMRVDRIGATIYVATLADSATRAPLLRSAFYREVRQHASP